MKITRVFLMKRTSILLLGILVIVVFVGGFFWFRQGKGINITPNLDLEQEQQSQNHERTDNNASGNSIILEPSKDYSVRPDFSKAKNFTKTLSLQKGVSVKYGDGWTAKRGTGDEFVAGGLFKTVNGRSYAIGFQENNSEYLSAEGAYANSLKVYEEVQINGKPHFIITSSTIDQNSKRHDYAYISSCPVKATEACSLPLESAKSTTSFLFLILHQNVQNAQYSVDIDFTRKDDQQILAEFAEIASTLQY